MKKLISILCVVSLLALTFCAVSFSAAAAEPAKTSVTVKSGDTVSYILYLQVSSEPVECADYSVYYDSSVFDVTSAGESSDIFNEDDFGTFIINTELPNEVRASFIKTPKGVDFSSTRVFVPVEFKAKKDATTNISYYVRDMAGESYFQDDVNKPEISDYVFTCDVNVNGSAVIEDAQPELNVDEPQSVGHFVNSVTGDSKEADVVISDEVNPHADPAGNGQDPDSGSNSGNQGGNAANSDETKADGTPAATSAQAIGTSSATAADGAPVVIAPADNAAESKPSGSSPIIWIIIAVVVVAAGCGIGYYMMKKKPAADSEKSSANSDSEE